MPRYRRLDGFLIQPDLILNDPAFLVMSDEAQRAYLILLLRLWKAKEPGIVPDHDRMLARMASVSEERWPSIRPELEPAFRIGGGLWTSQQMVETHRQQVVFLESRANGADKTNAKRRAQRTLSDTLSARDGDGDGEVDWEESRKRKARNAQKVNGMVNNIAEMKAIR